MSSKSPQRIAIDARMIYASTGRYIERLLHYLQVIDDENQYLVLLTKEDFRRWQPEAPNFHKIEADYPIYGLQEQFPLAWMLYRLNPDLVHFTMPQQPFLYFKKKITTIHDLTLFDFLNKRDDAGLAAVKRQIIKPWLFKALVRTAVQTSAHIITPTDYTKQQLISRLGLSPQKITVTQEAAEPYQGKVKVVESLANKRYLLYVGNAYPHKNLDHLVEAFSKLNQDDLHLVLVGKKDFFHRQLEDKVSQEKIPRVIFTDFVEDAELAWIYQHAIALVFPSLSEGFGLPGLEAMSYGVPVVASSASCLPEVLGDAAIYFDPNDVDDMAKTLSSLLADQNQITELKKAGPMHAQKFSWRKMAEQTLEIYNKAL